MDGGGLCFQGGAVYVDDPITASEDFAAGRCMVSFSGWAPVSW
ncbi:MAG: hypothetical protein R2856_36430 [Caldilineaceae bacterium]